MRLAWFRFLGALNKALLPKMYRKPNLERLTPLDKAIIGWKIWVTYRLLDAQSAQAVTDADNAASSTLGR